MDHADEVLRAVRQVARVLKRLDVPYAVSGSLASSVYGAPRFTQDGDLTTAPFAGQESAFVAGFGPGYYVSLPAVVEAHRRGGSFNVIDIQAGAKVDVFIHKDRPFDRSAFERRVWAPLGDAGDPLALVSAEDCILFKLEWYRLGNEASSQQWSDVLGVLRVQGERLDQTYLQRWAAELGVSDLLQRAVTEVGP